MLISFRYEDKKGFVTDVNGKDQVRIKNSLSDNIQNFSPTELLVLSIGSCTSDDVLSILRKMKQPYDTYRCTLEAEREEEIPKTLRSVNIHYELAGDLDPENVRKAVNLSLSKYCSVSILAKRGGAKVTYSITVNGKRIVDHVPE
ncbi:OsmC-like protein [Thermoplasmatales archaeon]|nr:OsmC-like protein [Thermoplasmatales archaeon]